MLPDLGHLFLRWQSVSAGTVLSEQEWLPGQWVPCQVQEGKTVLFSHKWFPPPPAPTKAGGGVSVAIKFPRPCFFPFFPPCLLSHVQLFYDTIDYIAHQAPLSIGFSRQEILEWVAISFSRGSFPPRDQTHISCIAGGFFTTEPPGKPWQCCRNIFSSIGSSLKFLKIGYNFNICLLEGISFVS